MEFFLEFLPGFLLSDSDGEHSNGEHFGGVAPVISSGVFCDIILKDSRKISIEVFARCLLFSWSFSRSLYEESLLQILPRFLSVLILEFSLTKKFGKKYWRNFGRKTPRLFGTFKKKCGNILRRKCFGNSRRNCGRNL